MARTPREYAERLGAKLADHPEAVAAICELARRYDPKKENRDHHNR